MNIDLAVWTSQVPVEVVYDKSVGRGIRRNFSYNWTAIYATRYTTYLSPTYECLSIYNSINFSNRFHHMFI